MREIAERLLGSPVEDVMQVKSGANSRMYCIKTKDRSYALKSYAERPGAGLEKEYSSLQFLWNNGITDVIAQPIAFDPHGRHAVFSWIEGTAVAAHGEADIDAVLRYLSSLHALRARAREAGIGDASEAAYSVDALFAVLANRVERLVQSPNAGVLEFLEKRFVPQLKIVESEIRARRQSETELAPDLRTISPSDFSFHNAIRRPDGELAFIDFEHFGFDDPVKLASDFLWHPAHRLAPAERERFIQGASGIYSNDPDFTGRWRSYYRIFGLKWALIVLNEFLASGWSRRTFSDAALELESKKAEQLQKAYDLVSEVAACNADQIPV